MPARGRLLRKLIPAIVLLLAGAAPGAVGASLRLSVTVEESSRDAVLEPGRVAAGLSAFANQRYGSLFELGLAGADGSVRISLSREGGGVVSVTELRLAGGPPKTLTSTLPRRAAGTLLPTLCGDVAYLLCASTSFSGLTLEQPPPMEARLSVDTLGVLTGWKPDELEPVALASGGGGVVLCFPNRYLTMGPLFAVTPDTMADIISQGGGGLPYLLSGVASAPSGSVFLSERAGTLIHRSVDGGRPLPLPAQGLAGPRARVTGGELAVLGSSSITLFPLSRNAHQRQVRTGAALASALSSDTEGNLWVFDAAERRVRVLSPEGEEVFSIKPLFSPALMPFPQGMAVLPDGDFLLAGSGEVWRFRGTGVPVWRLRRVPGVPDEPLPPSFDLAADPADGSFYVLDGPSRRVLQFAGDGDRVPAEEAAAAAFLRADLRDRPGIGRAADSVRAAGLPLLAVEVAGSLPDSDAAVNAVLAVMRDKAARAGELADALARGLLIDEAAAAYAAAAGFARAVRSRDPADPAAAHLLQELTTRLAEAREELRARGDLEISAARAGPESSVPCAAAAAVACVVRNIGSAPLSGLRLRVALPGEGRTPVVADVGSLAQGEERRVELEIALAPGSLSPLRTMVALATYSAGDRTEAAFFRFPAQGVPGEGTPAGAGPAAAELACLARAGAEDSVVQEAAQWPAGGSPFLRFLSVMEGLESLRSSGGIGAGEDAPAEGGEAFSPLMPRAALRGLSLSNDGWTVLTAAVAHALGCRAAVLRQGGKSFALLQSGIPLESALPLFGANPLAARVLGALAEDGTLTIALSAEAHPSLAGCLVAALVFLGGPDAGNGEVSWLDQAGYPGETGRSAASPFPIAFPPLRAAASLDSLAADVVRLLDGAR